MMTGQGIQVANRLYPLVNPTTGAPIQVRRWNDGQLPAVPEFKPGDGYNKRRVKPIDLMVWHWTGGEQDPIPMAEVLRQRKLGVEFAISRGGTVYQFCDPATVDTADAGYVNSRSIGCEIVCYGYRSVWDLQHAFGVPKLGLDREMYSAVTHGKQVETAKFYPTQVHAALALAEAISAAIPAVTRRVPSPAANMISTVEMGAFTGHIGHYHLTDQKRDCGPYLIDQLRYAFGASGVA